MELLKVQGSDNRFILLDQTLLDHALTQDELTAFTTWVCQAEKTDGVLVVDQASHAGPLGQMTVINADGSRASMCGNGLRTVARYLADKYGQDEFTVETPAADLRVARQENFAIGVPAFAVEISPIRTDLTALPAQNLGQRPLLNTVVPEFSDHLRFSTVAVPNPHLISFVEDDEDLNSTLAELGQRLNAENSYFPQGVNLNFAKILGKNQLFVRTYERGVGFTNACGTGMSATSWAFSQIFPEDYDGNVFITVFNPGGMVKTRLHLADSNPWIELVGNATIMGIFEVEESALHRGSWSDGQVHFEASPEQAAYQDFVAEIKK
ncbi:diaminopimelate epimerase [Eupransor demetentiae]|uniref:Diaminopimelate epimerase n=1 Tax=Eupransor demetentiae TaxID=3109584 RepID=A0ABP0ESY4_9LACO|nr:Diaminopimelate epimerase (DapF) [Lactobacillaceae bacterium LMG 33000]